LSVEAELKAIVRNVGTVRSALGERASVERATYADRYYDFPDGRLTSQGRELRVRTIVQENGGPCVLLTYKEPAVDVDSDSKPEHETTASDAGVLATVLTALGVREIIAFEKRCENYRFTAHRRDMLATLVTVPELDGQTFIELETAAQTDDVSAALDAVRAVLEELGIAADDLTTETYTDAVATSRSASGAATSPT
jgi:adenylate cyclase class 2